jgi:hypothetical protein
VVTWLYTLSSQAGPVGVTVEELASATADVETFALAYDLVLYDDGAITEGVSGGHAWTSTVINVGSDLENAELVKRVATLGARRLLLNGSRKLAAPFLEAGLVRTVVCYLPFRPPSARPRPASSYVVPVGYRLREIARGDDWVRIEADKV